MWAWAAANPISFAVLASVALCLGYDLGCKVVNMAAAIVALWMGVDYPAADAEEGV